MSGTSRQRNKVLAEIFSEMKLVEGWGSGLSLIQNETVSYGLKAPEFIESSNMFRINIFRKHVFGADPADYSEDNIVESSDDFGIISEKNVNNFGKDSIPGKYQLTKVQMEILRSLEADPYLTAEEISRVIGNTSRSVENNIKNSRILGFLKEKVQEKMGFGRFQELMISSYI